MKERAKTDGIEFKDKNELYEAHLFNKTRLFKNIYQ